MFKPKGVRSLTLVIILMVSGCSGPESDQPLLTAEVPLHLEEHIDDARIEGSEVREDLLTPVEWRFDEPQPDWKPAIPINKTPKPVRVIRTEDALRIELSKANFNPDKEPVGGIVIELPDLILENWGYVLVQARTSDKITSMGLGLNLNKNPELSETNPFPFLEESDWAYLIKDGSVQTYMIRADGVFKNWKGPWRQLGLWFRASEPGKIDILSVSVIPKEAMYAGESVGINTEVRSEAYRRALYTHAPGKLKYRIKVPNGARFDFGLGVLRKAPVTFRIKAKPKNKDIVTLLEETYSDNERWAQHSVDLSHFAGKRIDLTLETDAERPGAVALWAAPTISGIRTTRKPNIILYIIDGAGAELMSVYGYNRRTTPNLERLAAEGAIFEYAYSNSVWTKPSTPSFMTSLHHSVLGGFKRDSDPLPDKAVSMAQHMHHAGYQTAVFTLNPYCGTLSSLERGVDVLRQAGTLEPNSLSSKKLHNDFWKWREEYPSEPYWVHFQTMDVHQNWIPIPFFRGLFISAEGRKTYHEWRRRIIEASRQFGEAGYNNLDLFEKTGINQSDFFNLARCMYDEGMAHNDYKIGKMVERLKANGEWEHTILIVAADHSFSAAGLRLLDPDPPSWGPYFSSHQTRIPLVMIWPGHIAPGQRFYHPVSMIDILPTILELADLPKPEVMQGQSLAPLLLGKGRWEPRPVILDEFNVDTDTGELIGNIEVVDGRWGASLRIDPRPKKDRSARDRRPVPLLLYDLWNDPYCLNSLHEEQPEMVKKYTSLLQTQWKDHRELAKRFKRSEENPMTPEQLEILRSLGYIR